jgi:transglutaminase-like putative cysteine protease
MKTPPFLLAAALLFWGWRTGWWAAAIPVAALFEASRFVKFRWEFADKEYSRIVDACTLLAVGAMLYLRFSDDAGTRSGFVLFQWMPVILGLIVLAQAYGTREQIPYRLFSWFLRMRREKAVDHRGLNVSWIYFAICLMAAAATNERDGYFFIVGAGLCAWAVFATRVERYGKAVWAACLIAAAAGGWAGQFGWSGLQAALLPMFGELFSRWSAKEFDAAYSRTSMGDLQNKKGSGKIVLRVKAETGPAPQLLRQASFDTYRDKIWMAGHGGFTAVAPENDVTTWMLVPEPATNLAVRVSGYLPKRRGLLSLPQGAGRIRELPVVQLQTTGLGVARTDDAPGVVSYVADFAPGPSFDDPPAKIDSQVPEIEKPALDEIAAQLNSRRETNAVELVKAVERFFAQNFSYSLASKANAPKKDETLVSNFLRRTRTGHCEYFASATTLLLRELGIPARYAVGFSLQETKGETWIVRERHAHAWVLAWVDGAWREVDTTPGTWAKEEREEASWFEPVSDFFSELWFNFSYWRWLGQKGVISRVAPYLILPLVAILVWRIFIQKNRVRSTEKKNARMDWPGLDSEYYELEARLAADGHGRRPHETPEQWLRRLRADGIEHPSLPALVDLHYRYRFDPRGLEAGERKQLRELAKTETTSSR